MPHIQFKIDPNVRAITFGYLTIVHVEAIGHCGGLLLVNSLGRPIEFHCTAPVQENRAQRILYGKTYESFLYCEQIALALIGKAKTSVDILFIEREQLQGFARLANQPVLMLTPVDQPKNEIAENSEASKVGKFSLSSQSSLDASQLKLIKSHSEFLAKSIPVEEPFERILMAIEEAQAVVR